MSGIPSSTSGAHDLLLVAAVAVAMLGLGAIAAGYGIAMSVPQPRPDATNGLERETDPAKATRPMPTSADGAIPIDLPTLATGLPSAATSQPTAARFLDERPHPSNPSRSGDDDDLGWSLLAMSQYLRARHVHVEDATSHIDMISIPPCAPVNFQQEASGEAMAPRAQSNSEFCHRAVKPR